jgi:hypothetical protein
MRNRMITSTGALLALLVFLSFTVSQRAQTILTTDTVKVEISAPFSAQDISGVWYRTSPIQTFGRVNPTNNFNAQGKQGKKKGPAVTYEEAPFTAAGKAAFDKNKPGYGPRASPPAFGNDPMGTCDPLGVPRILNAEVGSSHSTWEIVMTPTRMFQFFQWHHDWREVWIDGRSLPKTDDLEPKWDGYSVGRWDGETFIVDSIGFDDRTWLDKFGYPHTDQMKLQERYRRVDHDTLELTMTLTDPEYYTKPWVSDTKIFKLNASPITEFPTGEPKIKNWDEQVYCAPSEEFKFNRAVRDEAGGKKN